MSFDYCDSNGNQYQLVPPYLFSPGVWYDVLVVVQAIPTTSNTVSNLANYYFYINGQMAYKQGGSGGYPSAVTRVNADIGKSDWSDAYWGGEIQRLNIYNYALNADQVNALYLNALAQCSITTGSTLPPATWVTPSTSTATPPAPLFSVFGSGYSAPSGIAYTYLTADPNDNNGAGCNIQSSHSGLAQLGGVSTQYVNLSSTSGPYTAGKLLPTIGGVGSGSQSTGTAGWTFEFMVKPQMTESFAKLFDFAQPFSGTCHYDILAGWLGGDPQWSFSTCDGNGNTWDLLNIANGAVPVNQWVHFTIVLAVHPTNASWSNYYAYTNGVLTGSTPFSYTVESVPRPNADLGRSSWASDQYWDGLIDFFNVYDQALSSWQVQSVYNQATSSGSIATSCPVVRSTTSTITNGAVWFQATFDSNPATNGATGFGWIKMDSSDSAADQSRHSGIITLDGVAQFVNLSSAAGNNSVGVVMPAGLGGAGTGLFVTATQGWSFEFVFKGTALRAWAKLMDFGTPGVACSSDIVFGWQGLSTNMTFSACDASGNGYPGSSNTVPAVGGGVIALGTWYHAVLIIQANMDGSVTYSAYINGVLQQAVNTTYYLAQVVRANTDLGRSDWADANWAGEIDTFRIYSVALNPNQVNTLYQASQTGTTPITIVSSSSSSSGSSFVSSPSSSSSSSGSNGGGTPGGGVSNSGGSSGLSGGAIAGIVIGSVVGVAILLLILFLLCSNNRRKKSASHDSHASAAPTGRYGEVEPSHVEMSHVNDANEHHNDDGEVTTEHA